MSPGWQNRNPFGHATARSLFLSVAAKVWRHAGRTGVSYGDHYEERGNLSSCECTNYGHPKSGLIADVYVDRENLAHRTRPAGHERRFHKIARLQQLTRVGPVDVNMLRLGIDGPDFGYARFQIGGDLSLHIECDLRRANHFDGQIGNQTIDV